MSKTLVILESPGKIRKVQEYLGSSYIVKASIGHIRDLPKKDAIDKKNNFEHTYIISPDKKDVVKELKELYKKCDDIILMTDPDREGNNIAWHICEVLGIDPNKVKRATTTEITKDAVNKAIKNPGKLDMNSVEAGTCRRLLDRLVGFDLSPLLWNKIKMGLSAGRVQSVGVKIIVEKEQEHKNFNSETDFKITGFFEVKDKNNKIHTFKAVLNKKFKDKDESRKFLEKCIGEEFYVKNIETKPAKRSAPAPFVTSSLQQEASKKFGYAPDRTMKIAQKLYEAGHISYMRTDSTVLSQESIDAAREQIERTFGKKYSNPKQFKTKSASAQEAHEAIRPTHFENDNITADMDEQKLYELIYKRTLASQMSDALLDRTTVNIAGKKIKEEFIAKGEVLKFDGFLKLYSETIEDSDKESEEDDNKSLPEMQKGQEVKFQSISAGQTFTKPSARYTEASLVKKLEELQIGRPSTYSTILKTIQDRGYIEKKDLPAKKRDITILILKDKNISEEVRSENFGAEKNKLFPTDIGILVTKYLNDSFSDIMDYKFTANMELQLDLIAEGKLKWQSMLKTFYDPFNIKVTEAKGTKEKVNGRELGIDPKTKKPVYAKIGKFGPMIQLGESIKQDKNKTKDKDKSDVKFVTIPKDKSIETITLEEALELLSWPKLIGEYKGKSIETNNGRFGPFVKWNSKFYSISISPETITLKEAIEIIEQKEAGGGNKSKTLKEFGEIKVIDGPYGPYINYKKKNFKIPATVTVENLTKEECMDIIENIKTNPPKKKFKKWKK